MIVTVKIFRRGLLNWFRLLLSSSLSPHLDQAVEQETKESMKCANDDLTEKRINDHRWLITYRWTNGFNANQYPHVSHSASVQLRTK